MGKIKPGSGRAHCYSIKEREKALINDFSLSKPFTSYTTCANKLTYL
jgi:hypothetical protein